MCDRTEQANQIDALAHNNWLWEQLYDLLLYKIMKIFSQAKYGRHLLRVNKTGKGSAFRLIGDVMT